MLRTAIHSVPLRAVRTDAQRGGRVAGPTESRIRHPLLEMSVAPGAPEFDRTRSAPDRCRDAHVSLRPRRTAWVLWAAHGAAILLCCGMSCVAP